MDRQDPGHAAESALPPDKLLPDRQPAYVASWIYVFGVPPRRARRRHRHGLRPRPGRARLVAHDSAGHFVNSLHLWSVEAVHGFFMVIHLWGKFWMAAWRGKPRADLGHRRGRVPRLGRGVLHRLPVAAELRLPVDLHHGKDAFNAAGVGAFFNVMNFGQMLMWHIVLLPLVLVAVIAGARPAGAPAWGRAAVRPRHG